MTCRILIASSSLSERDLMVSTLNGAGHITHTVVSIEEAMQVKDGGKNDLVIIDADFTLPGQGWLLVKKLRKLPWGKNLGIIIVTHSSPMSFMHDAEYRGLYNQVLMFPIDVDQLLADIERVMKLKKKKGGELRRCTDQQIGWTDST